MSNLNSGLLKGMDRKWTKRGEISDEDKLLIGAVVGQNLVSARIFVTGEVQEEALGTIAAGLLYAANDVIKEPLFVQTKDGTIQMARFDAEQVWRCFNPAILEKLVKEEGDRFGIGYVPIEEWDYYGSMVSFLQMEHGHVTVPVTDKDDLTSFYQTTYFASLWCFGKAAYMTVPASRHFALPETEAWMKNEFKLRALSQKEKEQLEELKLKYGEVEGLTNPELNFLLKLHDAGR